MAEEAKIVLDGGPPQPYHLVNPSIWPLVGATSAGVMAAGGVLWMHEYASPLILIIGLLGVLATMAGWWYDIIHESVTEKAHSPIVKIGLRFGMMLFIVSEVKFFVAFFWAYFHASFYPTAATGGVWPPAGIHTVDPWHLPLLMTLVLLLSGTTVTWAHHALQEGNRREAIQGLSITVALGVFFLYIQAYEYGHAPFLFDDGIYPSTFFMATGFHGFHVLVGTIFLAVCLWRTIAGHFTPESHFGFEAAAWYWHFVDVVWLFLFISIYIAGAGTVAH